MLVLRGRVMDTTFLVEMVDYQLEKKRYVKDNRTFYMEAAAST